MNLKHIVIIIVLISIALKLIVIEILLLRVMKTIIFQRDDLDGDILLTGMERSVLDIHLFVKIEIRHGIVVVIG
jgi:hypothetical protein